ncbi:MAG: hypothetical protein ACYYKD_10735 [Rhodospirillales bacterium]
MAVFKKDMACTRAEMAAGLARAFGAEPRAEGADILVIAAGSGVLRVTMGPQQTRTIAMLSIKHMDVTLAFEGMDDAAVREALTRFDRAFQRGGG